MQQIENIKNMAVIQNKVLNYYELKAKDFFFSNTITWESNVLTAVHKAYQHSAAHLNAERRLLQEVTAKELHLQFAWYKYIEYLTLKSKLSPETLRINSFTTKPQLSELATTCFLPLLRDKAEIKESYKVIQCIELTRNNHKRLQSASVQRKNQLYEIQTIATSKKEAIELNQQLFQVYNFKIGNEIINIAKIGLNQLLSRSRIQFLNSYAAYNGLIYYCDIDSLNKEALQNIEEVKMNSSGAIITLVNNTKIQLMPATFNDLLRHKNVIKHAPTKLLKYIKGNEIKSLYVLDKGSFNPPKRDITLRKLLNVEISELLYSYTGIIIPSQTISIDQLYSYLFNENMIFAFIKDNSANRHFFISLQKTFTSPTNLNKFASCKWPSCLSLSNSNGQLKALVDSSNLSSLEPIPIGFSNLLINNFSHFEMQLTYIPLYKVKGATKEISSELRKAKLYNLCSSHALITIALPKVYLYSVYSIYINL